ncbi:hypothetical protein B296_00011805 [Ensete ventricosum]|uniref:Uncharacterized protein n=1 Tax=Ensete ventricosum TaxID=4639 RepID=A0A427APA9_ENSVE|nr:hypothetical protein B296_00011805 [Ensete ventricosum]
MFRLYHISQLQDLVQNYLEYLGMAWFNHSLMLVRFHHQVRYPDKDAQYRFFKNYLEPEKPHEVRKLDGRFLPSSGTYLLTLLSSVILFD